MSTHKPRVLIEDWLPVAELGTESRRERTISVAIPPLSRIHVWWARRPLAASAGVVLAGLLPAWSDDVKGIVEDVLSRLSPEARAATLHPRPHLRESPRYSEPCEEWYRNWYLHLLGIWGDPVRARAAYDAAVASGVRIPNPYNYKQAYKNSVERHQIDLLHALLRASWGADELPYVLDSTAGGGSIPFEAARYGLPTLANDLNGVAVSILTTGVSAPAEFGAEIAADARRWATIYVDRIVTAMGPYFPSQVGEKVEFYLYANTISCPRTGRPIPLTPDWWLKKKQGKVAVRPTFEVDGHVLDKPMFEVQSGDAIDFDPSAGTTARGKAISPYDNLVVDADYIRDEAQSGRMWPTLYAVVIRKSNGKRDFRAPAKDDLHALEKASEALADVRSRWEVDGFLPVEDFPDGNDMRPLNYGMRTWADFFSDRQLLVHGTASKEFHRLVPEILEDLGESRGRAVLALLAQLQGKAVNWNSRLSSWNLNQQSMRSVFDRHDFAFKWTFAEYQGASGLYPWTLHVVDNFEANAELMDAMGRNLETGETLARSVRVLRSSAAAMPEVADASVAHLCMDPPYYDNVMYAELADFFYVWEKNTFKAAGYTFFDDSLTDKENEAVANPARFAPMGKRKKELADLDYEAKMTAIFGEARRVLRADGVLSVMFTHKRAEAWDTLGMGLLQAGFTIETSWPVNTEAENSLHQANMNSAASTIMLVCRKREDRGSDVKVYLDDIEHDIRSAARNAATQFQHDGIDGVDLLLSTYGPTLSVISQNWPVFSSTPDEDGRDRLLRPEDALALAREEIVELRRSRLVGKSAKVDSLTDFVLLAWDTFAARTFPYDTARLLALAVGGLDIEALERAKVVSKSAGTVTLLAPQDRVRRGVDTELPGVKPEASSFEYIIDAVDTALHVADADGMQAAKRFLDRHGYTSNAAFVSTLQGLANAIPRTKVKGLWVIPEAGLLDTLCTLYFEDVRLPEAEEMASLVADEPDALFDVD